MARVEDGRCLLFPQRDLKPGELGCARSDCPRCMVLDLKCVLRDLLADGSVVAAATPDVLRRAERLVGQRAK